MNKKLKKKQPLIGDIDFKCILESVPNSYLILNPQLIIVEVSDAYLKAMMCKRDNIIGRYIFDVFPDNPQNVKATGVSNLRYSLQYVLKTRLPHTMALQKYDIKRPDNGFEEHYWSPINTPVMVKDKVKYIIHKVEDVTEFILLKKSECTQQKLNESLTTHAGQMEAEILGRAEELDKINKQLIQAKENAEKTAKQSKEASQFKSAFLANMSHELRTPLNGIIGFAELMYHGKVGPVSAQHKEFLGDILSSSRHLLQLINDILDLTKIESGKMEFHPEPIDIAQIVNNVCDVLRTLIAKKHIHFKIEIDSQLNNIVIDPGKLKQVLYNYISNAIKFTYPHDGHVTVRVCRQGKHNFRIEVEDDGIGIAREDIPKLFVEFQQLHPELYKENHGTGLGLPVTRRLVEAQKGRVGVESDPGKRTIFYAVLPRQPVGYQSQENRIEQIVSPSFPSMPRILVIEDDPDDQAYIVDILTNAGFAVEIANTGKEALEKAKKRKYHAITLDLLLPDMNGWHLLHALRSTRFNKLTPTIVVTIVAEKAASFGVTINDFLIKPVNSKELISALMKAGIRPMHEKKIVLIIDDDTHTLKFTKKSLALEGYIVIGALDGERGLQAVKKYHPDIIVLDLLMPKMNGFDFLHKLRRMETDYHTPVIVWTVKDLTRNDQLRLRQYAQAVLQKGGNVINNLLIVIERCLNIKKLKPKKSEKTI